MKKVLAILLILAVAAVAFAGGDSEKETKASSNNGPVVINVGGPTGWDTLSPFRSNVGNNIPVLQTVVYESLGYLDGSNTLVPWAAKEWKTTDNGVTYDITLYDYITDSAGNKITSADLVWFVNTAKEKALKPNFKYVEKVEAIGDYTFKVTFNNTLVGVFETFMTDTFICSQAAYEKQGDDFVNSCITTSAYKCTEFVSGSSATFEKRADYWQDLSLLCDQLQPNVDKVTFHTIGEAAQLGIALETGVIDFAVQFPASTAVQFDGNKDFTLEKRNADLLLRCRREGRCQRQVPQTGNLLCDQQPADDRCSPRGIR